MPQNLVRPFMGGKMVDRNHGVKPRLYRRRNLRARIISGRRHLVFELAKLTQA
jgi:hypothetical protein